MSIFMSTIILPIYSAFFDAFVRNCISKYTKAYELIAKIATMPISRHP